MANGVEWYFNGNYSMGFANMDDALNRNSCDINAGPNRMCIHTGAGILAGFRCGDNTYLQGVTTHERMFLQHD